MKYKNTVKVLRNQRRERKAVKRRKLWLNLKRKGLEGKSVKQRRFLEAQRYAVRVKVPVEFSIKRQPDKVFEFIATLKNFKKRNVKAIFIQLKYCTYISNGAIALIISAIEELKTSGIKVSGSYPVDKKTRTILEKSGFFNYVIGNISEENKITLNTILQQGTDVVNSAAVAPLVLKAMEYVWGQPYRNPRVQSLLIELMANTVNHAFPGNKKSKWHLSMSTTPNENKVSFTFIDNGQGINRTLNIKFVDKIKALFLDSSNAVLKAAFDGKFGSRTKERIRGRGLPSVKRCYSENYISNLVVIANDVYLDFGKNQVKKLVKEFEGTCYYWELDLNCTPWKIL
ncbi:ATP-binding protein [bacterium]|nr:MAG: ATP-binding protein [bacterium]